MATDSEEYGGIVEELIGEEFERSLAANSLKLRFGTTEAGPKGTHYIWIDPPWEFWGPNGLITKSVYPPADKFEEWSELFNPINAAVLHSMHASPEGVVEFRLSGEYRILLPAGHDSREDDDWYGHWYAHNCTT